MGRRKRETHRIVDGKIVYELVDERKEMRRDHSAMLGVDPRDSFVYDPPEDRRIPKDGAWIMVLMVPHFGQQLSELRRGMMFYATHVENADDAGFMPDGNYKIRVVSPWGEFCLWPYEYSVMKPEMVISLMEAGEIQFHPMTERPTLTDELFYLRSRGIPLIDAMPMALGSLKEPVGWFEPMSGIAEMIEQVFGR